MINASSESNAAELGIWKSYKGSYWAAIRLVGWISQDTTGNKTTLYFKWQVGADNYWPYWRDTHLYTIEIGDVKATNSFALPQATNNWVDLTGTQSLTISHQQDGTYSGTMVVNGYKYWEAFGENITVEFPTISITPPSPGPSPTPSPSPEDQGDDGVPIINEKNPRFYILCDKEVLYAANDPDYALTNANLVLELNQTESLDITIPPTNAMYSKIDRLRSTIEVVQGKEVLFRGRVLEDSTDFYNNKSMHVEGALSFLGDTIMPPYEEGKYTTAKDFFKAIMKAHTSQVPTSTPYRKLKFTKCNVTDEVDVYNDEYSYTSEALSSLLDVGGFFKLEYYADGTTGLSYLNSYDHTSSQNIQFGENLLDLNMSISAADIYTSVVALGAADEETGVRLTIGDGDDIYVENQDAINKFGRIVRYFTFDDVTDRTELKQLAEAYLTVGLTTSVTIEVNAFDLHLLEGGVEKIRLGDGIYFQSLPHGLDGYYQVSRIDMDILHPENNRFTFGSTVKALTDVSNKSSTATAKKATSVPEPSNVVSYYQQPVKDIRSAISALNSDWYNFIFVTDPHSDDNTMHSQEMALYLLKNTPNISMMVLNGDYCKEGWNDTYYKQYVQTYLNSNVKSKIYATVGNHDFGKTTQIMADFLAGKNVKTNNINNGYYYFDDTSRKLRVMFLNTSDDTWLSVGSTQLDWIRTNVQLPGTDWKLIVIGHVNLDDDGLDALHPTEPYSMSLTNGEAVKVAIATCNGTIVGYFSGHQHLERTGYISSNGRTFQQTMMLCDRLENMSDYYPGYAYGRTAGEPPEGEMPTEQAVNVISINLKGTAGSRSVQVRRVSIANPVLSYVY